MYIYIYIVTHVPDVVSTTACRVGASETRNTGSENKRLKLIVSNRNVVLEIVAYVQIKTDVKHGYVDYQR